jgi:twitching motility protein PilJ
MTTNQPKLKNQHRWIVYLATTTLIASLAFVAVTFFLLARHAKHEQEWNSLATEVQVTSQQLAKSAGEAASGNLDAFLELGNSRSKINAAMENLLSGSVPTLLPPTPLAVDTPMKQLNLTWNRISANASSILDREKLILELAAARNIVQKNIPDIQKNTEDSIRSLTQSGAPTNQVVLASQQLVLADRILRHVFEIRQGGSNAVSAAENLGMDRDNFNRVLTALLNGSSQREITRVKNTQALQSLAKVKSLFDTLKPQINTILNSSGDLFAVRGAADEIFLDSRDVFDEASNLKSAIADLPRTRPWPSQTTGAIGIAVMISVVWILVYSFLSAERQRAKIAARSNKENQQAIMRLLDEMSSLADGDLTVHASVTEDITGAIADSVNFAIEQLRELVKGIKFTAQEVAGSAMETQRSTSALAKAAAMQAEQVGEATKTVQKMAQSFDTMARRSSESSDVAHKSVDIAQAGSKKVRETISGMDTIREQIQQTSKRIKRLGESTQEIGDIVELINGIAEQTNVLALNAAIQAASAGGAGKGFAVVADEVQQLAESATNATRRIESLVQTIQADTSEAVVSMESTTSEVVSGARLAEDAGTALEQIELVSNDLSKLIAGIAEEAHAQSATATEISGLMKSVQEVSIQTSEGSNQTATSVEKLAVLVMQLSDSVTDFKLPEND